MDACRLYVFGPAGMEVDGVRPRAVLVRDDCTYLYLPNQRAGPELNGLYDPALICRRPLYYYLFLSLCHCGTVVFFFISFRRVTTMEHSYQLL